MTRQNNLIANPTEMTLIRIQKKPVTATESDNQGPDTVVLAFLIMVIITACLGLLLCSEISPSNYNELEKMWSNNPMARTAIKSAIDDDRISNAELAVISLANHNETNEANEIKLAKGRLKAVAIEEK